MQSCFCLVDLFFRWCEFRIYLNEAGIDHSGCLQILGLHLIISCWLADTHAKSSAYYCMYHRYFETHVGLFVIGMVLLLIRFVVVTMPSHCIAC